jgi:hypothetical protein
MYTKKALGLFFALSLLVSLTAEAQRHTLRGPDGRFISKSGTPKRVRHGRAAASLARKLYRAHKKDSRVTEMSEGGVKAKLYNMTHGSGMLFLRPPKAKPTDKPYISIHTEGAGGYDRSFTVKGVRLEERPKNGHPFQLVGGRVTLRAAYRSHRNASYTEAGPSGVRRSTPDMDRRTWTNTGTHLEVPLKYSAQPRDPKTGRFLGTTPINKRQWIDMSKGLE